ncbi:MAG: nicotinate (nicotinamide) nucleotide adenylyltransferase [Planctomycetota bacterium]|nr:nicotinate (nicotinamide) nucleotide adenylyltransferase [Planctomycetota bacterium]
MSRTGVFGGTFDPVHTGHLIAAQQAIRCRNLDKIVFVPCAASPHKVGGRTSACARRRCASGIRSVGPVASARDRLAMVRLAIRGNPAFAVSGVETERGGVSYTIDTLRALKAGPCRRDELFLIVGADSLRDFHAWRDPRGILMLARLTVLARPGFDLRIPHALADAVGRANVARILRDCVRMPLIEISSRELRKMLARKEDVTYLVPESVLSYIRRNRLY